MNKSSTIKIVGTVITILGFGITFIQKQLDDHKLQEMVAKEVREQLNKK